LGEFYEIFSEAGPLAAFAAFLAWRSVQEVKRTDAREERFLGTIKDMEERRDSELEAVRDRWAIVVDKAEAERRLLAEGVEAKIDRAIQAIETGLGEMRAHYTRIETERAARMAATQKEK
jgi:hypothetical protein